LRFEKSHCTSDINAAINMLDNTFHVRTYFTYI